MQHPGPALADFRNAGVGDYLGVSSAGSQRDAKAAAVSTPCANDGAHRLADRTLPSVVLTTAI